MSQRYFLTAESTYEDLRQALNTSLSYPNALGKSVFQTALYAPRDSFRRVLLAVDTDLPGYATINDAITPLLASDAMEEIDEATYLAALASATAGGGVSSWNDLTDKPATFPPDAHKSTHATGGSDALTAADIGAAAVSHAHSAGDITAGTTAGLVIKTGTGGVLEALAQGTAGQVLKVNGTATGVEWGSASSEVTIDTTAADVLSASTGSISADDPGADRLVFWDDSASKLTHLTVGTGLTITDTTITSAGSTSASDLTSGTLGVQRLPARVRNAANLYLWSSFR